MVGPGARLHQDQPGCAHCYAQTFAERFSAACPVIPMRLVPPELGTGILTPAALDLRELDDRSVSR